MELTISYKFSCLLCLHRFNACFDHFTSISSIPLTHGPNIELLFYLTTIS
jgi:hypothetical protein